MKPLLLATLIAIPFGPATTASAQDAAGLERDDQNVCTSDRS